MKPLYFQGQDRAEPAEKLVQVLFRHLWGKVRDVQFHYPEPPFWVQV
jgi:hypothetical protein